MNLEEAVGILFLSYALEWIVKMHALKLVNKHEKAVTDDGIQEKIKELLPKHPMFAAILEGIHQMDLKETVKTVIGIEGLKWLMKARAAKLALN